MYVGSIGHSTLWRKNLVWTSECFGKALWVVYGWHQHSNEVKWRLILVTGNCMTQSPCDDNSRLPGRIPQIWSQQASGHRPLACCDLGFESHRGHGYLSVVSVVCCQVEASATSWSLVQRSPTDCAASLCVISKHQEWVLHIYIYDITRLRVNNLTLILLTWRKWWAPNNTSK